MGPPWWFSTTRRYGTDEDTFAELAGSLDRGVGDRGERTMVGIAMSALVITYGAGHCLGATC